MSRNIQSKRVSGDVEGIAAMRPIAFLLLLLGVLLVGARAYCQLPGSAEPVLSDSSNRKTRPALASASSKSPNDKGYILGPGDQITVRILNVEESTDKPIPIDLTGQIRLPMIGRLTVEGLTVAQAETEIGQRLRAFVLHPDVTVLVAEYRSQPVSVIGAVKNPGVQQVQGRKTLVEMLSLAGGLDTTARNTLKITRRVEWGRIPLPNAADDSTGQFSIAEVNLKSIMEGRNPAENILIQPHDVISVPRAEVVYVIGQVQKAGGFTVNEQENVTVLQALSMAGGVDRTAQPQNARILRRQSTGTSRTEIAVDLKKVLEGKSPDIGMQPDDILFVPSSTPKKAAIRAAEAAVQMATGIVIWRR